MDTLTIIGATWLAIAVATVCWFATHDMWTRRQLRRDRCLCGQHDLAGIHAQHGYSTIHERGRCWPARERCQQ